MAPDQPVGNRVKGTAEDAQRPLTRERADPSEHLTRRTAGEGQDEEPFRRDALIDEPRDPRGQCPRLSGAGTGDDEQRLVRRRRRRDRLCLVERSAEAARIEHTFDTTASWCPVTVRTAPGDPTLPEPGFARTYDRGISFRIALMGSVVLLAAAGFYVARDRSRLETRVHDRQALPAHCRRRTRSATACGAAGLLQIRRGDLLGVPFLILAVGLSLILVFKIANPPADDRILKVGDSRADDALL